MTAMEEIKLNELFFNYMYDKPNRKKIKKQILTEVAKLYNAKMEDLLWRVYQEKTYANHVCDILVMDGLNEVARVMLYW